jgi:hypothetical protein
MATSSNGTSWNVVNLNVNAFTLLWIQKLEIFVANDKVSNFNYISRDGVEWEPKPNAKAMSSIFWSYANDQLVSELVGVCNTTSTSACITPI